MWGQTILLELESDVGTNNTLGIRVGCGDKTPGIRVGCGDKTLGIRVGFTVGVCTPPYSSPRSQVRLKSLWTGRKNNPQEKRTYTRGASPRRANARRSPRRANARRCSACARKCSKYVKCSYCCTSMVWISHKPYNYCSSAAWGYTRGNCWYRTALLSFTTAHY